MKEEQYRRAEDAPYSAPGDATYVAPPAAGVVTKRISWGAIIGGTIIALVTQITLIIDLTKAWRFSHSSSGFSRCTALTRACSEYNGKLVVSPKEKCCK
jgi:hypothetical protein